MAGKTCVKNKDGIACGAPALWNPILFLHYPASYHHIQSLPATMVVGMEFCNECHDQVTARDLLKVIWDNIEKMFKDADRPVPVKSKTELGWQTIMREANAQEAV